MGFFCRAGVLQRSATATASVAAAHQGRPGTVVLSVGTLAMVLPVMLRWVALVSTALMLASVMGAGAASADPRSDKRQVDGRIDRLQEELEDTSADLARAFVRLQKTKAELPGARAALAQAQGRVAEAKARDLQLGRQLAVAQATEQQAVDDLAKTAASTAKTKEQVGGIARQAYQSGGVGELSVVLSAQSADDFAERVSAIDIAFQLQSQVLADLDVKQAQTRALKARLTAVRRQIALLKAQAEAQLEQARRLEQEAAAAQAKVEALVAAQQQAVTTISARRAAERRRLDGLEGQRRTLEAQLRAIAARERAAAANSGSDGGGSGSDGGGSGGGGGGGGGGSGVFTSGGGYLLTPISGASVSSEFGRRFHPILRYWRLHAGIDFAAACGTPVRAAASGQIISAGWGGGYGNRIVVTHGKIRGSSLATTYNHLSQIVRAGGSVSRGQVIGYSGTTGSSTGCHLHFETYQSGSPVNPRGWL